MQIFVIDWQDVLVDSSDLPTYLAATYQPLLVSGTSIKTINGQSLLGAGNIAISVDLSGYLPIAGGTMAGNLDMDHYQISNVQAIDSDEITLNGLPVASEQYASNASNLSTGTVSDNRLSGNVPLKNAANTFTQPQVLPAGSAASPALRLGTDTNSGIYQAGSNMVGISIAGSEMFRAATSIVYCFATTFQTYGSILIGSAGDVRIVRNATGPTLETRAAGGLKVANADGSALAAVVCSNITVGDNFGSSGKVTTGVGLDWGVGFGNRGTLGAFADGIFGFRTLATTAGFLIDCTTDGTAKLRNRSNTADGSLNLANLTATQVSVAGAIRSSDANGLLLATDGSYSAGFRIQNLGSNGKARFGNFAGVGFQIDTNTADTLTLRNAADSAGGNISLGAGTAAACSVQIAGAGNGFYQAGASSIGVAVGGSQRAQFWNDGSLYLSGATPWFQIGSTNSVVLVNSASGMNVTSNGSTTTGVNCSLAKFTGYPTSLLPAAASNAGAITYDTTISKHVGCNGSSWNALW